MSNILKSIEELVQETPPIDNQASFNELWKITCEIFEKVRSNFELTIDPCCADVESYSGKDGAGGQVKVYAGPKIDWLVHSWTGNPKATFTNMHLTITLAPSIDAPNLGFALGTTPDLFMYMDYLPRVDMAGNPDYVEKYYNGVPNQRYIQMMGHPNFKPFISRHMYMRSTLTPVALCFGAANTAENIAKVREMAHAHVDHWLEMVAKAATVPEAERAAIAKHDLTVRQTVAQTDPANVVGEAIYGKELIGKLVDNLWGGSRTLPRAK